jgi:solute carrier family 25 (peroxisomal adenine nucleotide transporter), member 17
MEHAVSGSVSGVISISLTYPLVTLSTILQARKAIKNADTLEKKQTIVHQIAQLYEKGELYNGLSSCISGIAATNFVYYYFFETLSKIRLNRTKRKNLTFVESTAIGFIAGSITAIATNPIWTANTRLITSSSKDQTLIGTIKEIIRDDGVMALFKGLKPALILVLNPVIQYSIFEQMKNLIYVSREDITPRMSFFLGAVSKIIATVLTYPTITVKTQSHLQKDQSVIGMLRKIIEEDGFLGLFKGLKPKIIQSVLTSAFLFYFKQKIMDVLKILLKIKRRQNIKMD